MFSISCEGTDISDYIISFERNVQICTGVGTLDFTCTKNVSISFSTWDTVLLYENGNKKGTFNISTITREATTGNYSISCQDNSKRLIDYFITDSYEIDYYSTSRYWIELFLNEAGLDYTINSDGEGQPLSENTTLGLTSAYDAIIQLLQLNGWYIYFDEDGRAIVGSLDADLLSSSHTFTDSEILTLKENTNDSMLRNRAVVWGNSGVFYDNSIHTQWNYDTLDKRAVVLANSSIRDYTLASSLGQTLLDEFAQITDVVTIDAVGYYNLTVGDLVRINSDYYSNTGLITTLSSRGSSSGFITTITINERCPRMFGFFSLSGDYVYVGTAGNGVWRKGLSSTDWENFSTGLPEGIAVTDLYVNNGIFGLTTSSGTLYHRTTTSGWTLFTPPTLYDETLTAYPSDNLFARRLTINHITDTINAGYNASGINGFRSWVLQISPSGGLVRSDLVTLSGLYSFSSSGIYNYNIIDIDTDDTNNILTLKQDDEKIPITNLGYRTYPQPLEKEVSVTILPKSDNTDVVLNTDYIERLASIAGYGVSLIKPIVQAPSSDRIYAYFATYLSSSNRKHFHRVKYTLTWVSGSWTLSHSTTTVSTTTSADSNTFGQIFFYKEDDDDDIVYLVCIDGIDASTSKIRRYTVNFSAGTYTIDDQTLNRPEPDAANDYAKHKNQYIHGLYPVQEAGNGFVTWWSYNILTNTLSEDNDTPGIEINKRLDGTGYYYMDFFPDLFYWIPIDDGNDFIYGFTYRGTRIPVPEIGIGPTVAVGLVYGNKTTTKKEYLYYSIGAYPAAAFENYSVGFNAGERKFYGDQNYAANLVLYTGFYITNGPYPNGESPYTDFNIMTKVCIDNLVNLTSVSQDLATSNTTERSNFFRTDFGIYLVSRADCTRRGTWSYSSKNSELSLFLQQIDLTGTQSFADSATVVVKLPEFEDLVTIKKPGSDHTTPPYLYGNMNQEDFGDLVYVIADDNGLNSVLHTYDLAGNLINRYSNITENVSLIACGFRTNLSLPTSITFMYPKTGTYYYKNNFGCTVAKQEDESFDRILYTPFENYHLEISKNYPTEVFSIASGTSVARPIYQATIPAAGEFTTIIHNNLVYDGRVFDQTTPSGARFFGIATPSGAFKFPTATIEDGFSIIVSTSGISRIETTNFFGNQYIFVSVSGVVGSGITGSGVVGSGVFYQKNPDTDVFTDYSSGLPGSEITVIRTDDLI